MPTRCYAISSPRTLLKAYDVRYFPLGCVMQCHFDFCASRECWTKGLLEVVAE